MVNPVFTKFLIYLTYIISGMVLIYSSKKANLGVFFPSLQKNQKKKPTTGITTWLQSKNISTKGRDTHQPPINHALKYTTAKPLSDE